MPRKSAKDNQNTIVIPLRIWPDLERQLTATEGARQETHAVLVGARDADTTSVHLAVADDASDAERTEKRHTAAQHDYDIIGQVHLTYEDLDLVLARTSDEQRGRRQDEYSLPEGHVFVHVHRIGRQTVVCAHIARNGKLESTRVVFEGSPDEPTSRLSRDLRHMTYAERDRLQRGVRSETSGDETP